MGPYVLLQELGQGGMGAVYIAEHVALRRRVALKLRLAGAADDEGARRFLVEAQAAARLRHPGIVAVHETGRDAAGQPWIAMDLVEGEPLDALVERAGPLPPEEVVRIGLRAARALAHAHAQGILHRDLKPGNLLLRRSDGAPLLVDFGLAKLIGKSGVESLTKTGDVLGTPAYMPPEQANGEALDARADVWSLGATLYHLAVGRAPFHGAGLVQTLAAVLKGRVVPPRQLRPDLPADLEAVLLHCLTADRARRCPSAVALADELERLSRGEGSQALAHAQARRRLRLGLAALGVVAFAALLGGLAAALLPERPDPTPRPGPAAVATSAPADPLEAPIQPRAPRHTPRPRRARTREVEGAGDLWTRRGDKGPRRWSTAAAYDPESQELYFFGGRTDGKVALGDLWSWNGESWLQHHEADGPDARFGHAMAWDTWRGRLVLVGGARDHDLVARSATVWELDGDGWTHHDPPAGPGPRAFHGLAFDPRRRRVLLFGGGGGGSKEAVDEHLWSWDGSAWTVLPRAPGERGPSPRRHIGMAWDAHGDALYVAGASTRAEGAPGADAELWRWRPAQGWELLPMPEGRGREQPALAATPRGLFLFAGGDREGPYRNDLWRLRDDRWAPLLTDLPAGLLPRARRYATLAFDDARGALVLFGGEDAESSARLDLWELAVDGP